MKETEIRIGNYFYHKSFGNYQFKKSHFGVRLNFSEPIPITEEWLLKFGFVIGASREKVMFSNENFIKTINIFGGEDNDWGVQLIDKYKDKTESFVLQDGIQYIHELQNIYFALTGYELEIKN